MKGELFINGKDAYVEWGLSLSDTALSALLTPAGMKDPIENKSRALNGKKIISIPRQDERNLSLEVHFCAKTKDVFWQRYKSFCDELAKEVLEIKISLLPDVVFRTTYVNCTQFSQFMQGIAKFTLRLNEPDPTDREVK